MGYFKKVKEDIEALKGLTEEQQNIILKEQMRHTLKKRRLFISISFAIAMVFTCFGLWNEIRTSPKPQKVEAIITMEELGYPATEVTYSNLDVVTVLDQEVGKVYALEISTPLGSADQIAHVNLELYDIENESYVESIYQQMVMKAIASHKSMLHQEEVPEIYLLESYEEIEPHFYAIDHSNLDSAYCIFDINNIDEMPVTNVCFIKKDHRFAYIQYSKTLELTSERIEVLFSVLDRISDFKEK